MLDHPPSTRRVYLYHCLTLGLYFVYWCSRSRAAVNAAAKQELVPPTWMAAVPAANYWWVWQYAAALEHVSYKRIKAADTFLLFVVATFVPGTIGSAVLNVYPINDSSDWGDLWPALLVWVISSLVALALGLAFFCAATQAKINQLRSPQPPTAT